MKCYILSCLGMIFLQNLCYASLPEPPFECDFEKDTCGFFNDDVLEASWERKQMDVGGRKSTMMAVKTSGEKKQTARLLSPVFDGHWNNVSGCIALDMYRAGGGIDDFLIKQEDESGINLVIGFGGELKIWIRYLTNIKLGDFVRFIFEGNVNPELGETLIVIDNVSFKLGEC